MRAFLSVGRVSTAGQGAFVERLEAKLRNSGVETRSIGRNAFTSGQPLDKVKEEMLQCRGLVAVAFERTLFPPGGRELRLQPLPPIDLPEQRYATPWHQIEISMAYTLGLPIFVIAAQGVKPEGLLEDKYGWYVFRTELSLAELETDEFNGILDDWCSRLKTARVAEVDVPNLSLGQVFRSLKLSQVWVFLATVLTLAGTLLSLGAWAHSKGLVGGPEKPPTEGPGRSVAQQAITLHCGATLAADECAIAMMSANGADVQSFVLGAQQAISISAAFVGGRGCLAVGPRPQSVRDFPRGCMKASGEPAKYLGPFEVGHMYD